MKFFHHDGNEAQTPSSHRRFHKQIQEKTDLWSIYTCFGTKWQRSITPMFIFQFWELMTEENIWQYGVQGRHLSPNLSDTRSISWPPWPARSAVNLLLCYTNQHWCRNTLISASFCLRFWPTGTSVFHPQHRPWLLPLSAQHRGQRHESWNIQQVLWCGQTEQFWIFLKCQVINHLYKGSDHQLQRDVPGVSH